MSLAHIHLLLNHWPIIGAFVGLFLFLAAFFSNSDDLKQTSLAVFTLIAILAIPTYFSGDVAYEVLKESTPLPKELINTHQGAAFWTARCDQTMATRTFESRAQFGIDPIKAGRDHNVHIGRKRRAPHRQGT